MDLLVKAANKRDINYWMIEFAFAGIVGEVFNWSVMIFKMIAALSKARMLDPSRCSMP